MISEQQLKTWTGVGADTSAQKTYASIKAALAAYAPLQARLFDVYLQGSYRNSTNIYGDSDVDVVVEYTGAFYPEFSRINEADRKLYSSINSESAAYAFTEFRNDVQAALYSYYKTELVTPRNKCIQVTGENGRINADVVPCLMLKQFRSYSLQKQDDFFPGIKLFTKNENREVINYPKPHFDNGAEKNKNTDNFYKPTVRMFKNFRNWLEENSKIKKDSAPSYFIECLLSNVSNSCFKEATWKMVLNAIIIELAKADLAKYTCQNGLVWLFGTSPEQWDQDKAKAFILAALEAASS